MIFKKGKLLILIFILIGLILIYNELKKINGEIIEHNSHHKIHKMQGLDE